MKKGKKYFWSFLLAIITMLIVGILYDAGWFAVLLMALSGIFLLFIWKNKAYCYVYLFTLLLSFVLEAVSVFNGFWTHHTFPQLYGVPYLIIFAWAELVLIFVILGEYLS